MRTLALVASPGAFHGGIGAMLDLSNLANGYASSLFAEVEPTLAIDVKVLSMDGGRVAGCDGRTIVADAAIAAEPFYDGVFVAALPMAAGGLHTRLAELAPISAWLADQHRRGAWVAGAGAAIFILAEAGLLAGGRCAPPWPRPLERDFRRRYRDIELEVGASVAEWDRTLTARAMALEPMLALHLIEAVCAPNLADVLGKLTRIGGDLLAADTPRSTPAAPGQDRLVARAEDALQRNFSHPVNLQALAGELGVSHRTLLRRFRKATGQTPQAYLQTLRVESAKQMLAKSSRPIERIGFMVGYGDGRFFKEVFRRHVGVTPAEFRRRAGEPAPT